MVSICCCIRLSLKSTADPFIRAACSSINRTYREGVFRSGACHVPAGQFPEQYMELVFVSLLNEQAIDRMTLAVQAKHAARQAELL